MDAFTIWLIMGFIIYQQSDKTAPLLAPIPKETMVLLPDAEGKRSGIVIKSMGQEVVVTEPYQGVELTGGKINHKAFSAAEVQDQFPEVIQSLPEKPSSFTLRFEQNGTSLTTESTAMMSSVRLDIAKRISPEITVVGHTDRAGSDEANLLLSVKRAEAVRDILVAAGVPVQIIQVIGRGEMEMAVITDDGVAEPLNRRVEITVR